MPTRRFPCPSSDLSLVALLRSGWHVLLAGLGLAVMARGSPTRIAASHAELKAAKPLTTHVVKRLFDAVVYLRTTAATTVMSMEIRRRRCKILCSILDTLRDPYEVTPATLGEIPRWFEDTV